MVIQVTEFNRWWRLHLANTATIIAYNMPYSNPHRFDGNLALNMWRWKLQQIAYSKNRHRLNFLMSQIRSRASITAHKLAEFIL